jgi:HlyD family secretion protein
MRAMSGANNRSYLLPVLVFAVGFGAGAGPAYYYGKSEANQVKDAKAPSRPGTTKLSALGRIEPAKGIVHVSAGAPDILQQIMVNEGDPVKQGQPLGVLTSRKAREIEYALALAQRQEAEERLKKLREYSQAQLKESDSRARQLKSQGPLDVAVQRAKIEILEGQLRAANDLLKRMTNANGYAQQELNQHRLLARQAEQELNAARAVLSKIQEANTANLEPAHAQREAALAGQRRAETEIPWASLEKNVELTKERLEHTTVRAPAAGKILKVLVREGELVATQPIFQIADTSSMIVVAEVYQTDIDSVRGWCQGNRQAKAEAKFTSGSPTVFHGDIESKGIGRLIKGKDMYALDPRQDVDRRVMEVRINLDPESSRKAEDFIHAQVDVTISPPEGAGKD